MFDIFSCMLWPHRKAFPLNCLCTEAGRPFVRFRVRVSGRVWVKARVGGGVRVRLRVRIVVAIPFVVPNRHAGRS